MSIRKLSRHTIVMVVCIVAIFGAGILANIAWNHSQSVAEAKAATSLEAKKQADAYAAKERAKKNAEAEAAFKAECAKEVDYYNTLTLAQKKLKTAPTCDKLEIVQ